MPLIGSLFVLLAIYISIAYFLGHKRQTGFGWTFFFCIFLTPIGGLIVTLLSSKSNSSTPETSKSKKIWGTVLIIIGTLSIIGSSSSFFKGKVDTNAFTAIFWAIGIIGLGYYLIELGNGKVFNKLLNK